MIDQKEAVSNSEHSQKQAKLGTPASTIQKALIQESWKTYVETGKWALLRPMYRQLGKHVVVRELSALPGFLSEHEDHQSGNRLALHLTAVLLIDETHQYLALLTRYFEFQLNLFLTESEIREIQSAEVASKLQFSPDKIIILGRLLQLGGGLGGYVADFSSWSVRTLKEAEDFSEEHLSEHVAAWIQKSYWPQNPVFIEERRNKQLADLSIAKVSWPANPKQGQVEPVPSLDGNPFRRKYQVFVSSTYGDLTDERKYVMQALLETKCIPSGMELFPAASTEQMKLIRTVIDDCDYYLVIVAGKYGSCGAEGISYTEMEFDYAVSKKKPILAFFHSDIKKLPGEKLEETDETRRRLTAFTAKIKHQRMCRPWNTADGLASAIKTAIVHAIETNPKPGWVRADTVPTWNMVQNLEERIAELEGRPTPSKTDNFPIGSDQIEFEAEITWDEAKSPQSLYGARQSFTKRFTLSWDELFLHVAPKSGTSTTRNGLFRSFGHSLAKEEERGIKAKAKNRILRMSGLVDGALFDQILHTLLAQKLLKQVSPPKKVRTRIPYWQLAPKGIQKLAELRAIRAPR